MTTGFAPGSFWYDFASGPALGGVGALLAAILIGVITLKVSRDRRDDAERDRAVQQERGRREEWFRRLQWAQELTREADESSRVVGFAVLQYLGESELASADDAALLLELTRTRELVSESSLPKERVEASEYVRDDGLEVVHHRSASEPRQGGGIHDHP